MAPTDPLASQTRQSRRILAILIGALLIWGIYLFINCRISHLHMDDAFSALRIKGYKQFLRLRVEPDKLTIYPIGLKRVPMRFEWRARTPEERAKGVRAASPFRRGCTGSTARVRA